MDRQALIDSSVQPGGRAPAPDPLELVQAFVNTVDREHGPDLLDDPASWRAWCAHRDLDPGDAEEARPVREALRALLRANAGHPPKGVRPLSRSGDAAPANSADPTLDHPQDPARPDREVEALEAAAERPGLRVRFGPARVEARDADAVAAVLAQAFNAMAGGEWARLKACPGERCGWAYYDRSVNGSSAWCSMKVCGGRAKARAYYRRRTSG